MKAEGTFEYEALLFIPSRAPFDLFLRGRPARRAALRQARVHHGRLRGADAAYLRFVKGVVDAHDLSLNISREILQQDRQIQLIRRRLVKKVLATLKDMMDAATPERYRTFWRRVRPGAQGGAARPTPTTATPSWTSARSPRPPSGAS